MDCYELDVLSTNNNDDNDICSSKDFKTNEEDNDNKEDNESKLDEIETLAHICKSEPNIRQLEENRFTELRKCQTENAFSVENVHLKSTQSVLTPEKIATAFSNKENETSSNASQKLKSIPIIFHIHGGGFLSGTLFSTEHNIKYSL
jgi:hypothetical protein